MSRESERSETDFRVDPAEETAKREIRASDLPRMVAPGLSTPPARCALVPDGGVFEGQVALVGETRIDGCVRGRVRGEGRLLLGPRGRIEGLLECDEVDSEGAIQGPIHARRQLRLGPSARLDGDVETPRLEVCPTAIWNGFARVGSRPTEVPSELRSREADAAE